MTPSDLILVAVNGAVCLSGMWVCLTRMTHMSRSKTKKQIRIQYSIWFGFFAASMLSWTYGDSASPTQLAMTTAVFFHLLLGTEAWRLGAPEYTNRPMEASGD